MIDSDSFDNLHSAASAEVGVYISGDESALSVIGSVLQSVGASVVPTSDGTLRAVLVGEPTGSPTQTLTLNHIAGGSIALNKGPTDEGDGVPAWGVSVKWGRVWQTQTSTQLAGAVTEQRKAYLAQADREATQQDNAVLTAHPLSAEISIDAFFAEQADAESEAIRRLAMHSVRRDYPQITVHRDYAISIALGDEIAIDIDRFGFDGGKSFIVVGRADDFNARTVDLSLWG